MTRRQLPAAVGAFTLALRRLADALDPDSGWYGVFLRRDPEGIAACLDGREIMPRDVVEALLADLAAARHATGGGPAAADHERLLSLQRQAAAAYDRAPGGRVALLDRLDVMLRERQYATSRERELTAALRSAQDAAAARAGTAAGTGAGREAARLAGELAWAQDDHARATARCVELRARLDGLEALPGAAPRPGSGHAAARDAVRAPGTSGAPDPAVTAPAPDPTVTASAPDPATAAPNPGPATAAPVQPDPDTAAAAPKPAPGPSPGRRGARKPANRPAGRPRGARFAGLEAGDDTAPAAPPVLPGTGTEPPSAPRGARFAGAYGRDDAAREQDAERQRELRAAAVREAGDTAAALGLLRASGRSGDAYALLCEAAARPASRLPLIAEALERADLAAEVATLLWEAACLPPPALAEGVCALADAGRAEDARILLSQAVGRPAADVAHTALALRAAGRPEETAFLLTGVLRTRTAEEAVRVAEPVPAELVPPLLDAAAAESPHRYRDLAHALRGAGLPGAPEAG
ncbi:hypothetical protein [Streptomyces sp. Ru87]|nr:hypothetical protein [Streptomyces sp. Ru87]PGH47876.1 hypothetical protein CRI70_26180 [Streptomyces sp. Ru87]